MFWEKGNCKRNPPIHATQAIEAGRQVSFLNKKRTPTSRSAAQNQSLIMLSFLGIFCESVRVKTVSLCGPCKEMKQACISCSKQEEKGKKEPKEEGKKNVYTTTSRTIDMYKIIQYSGSNASSYLMNGYSTSSTFRRSQR